MSKEQTKEICNTAIQQNKCIYYILDGKPDLQSDNTEKYAN